MTKTTM
jgi:hypothetical protein